MKWLESAWSIKDDVAELAEPPERLTVPESAERNVVLDVKGGYYGAWDNKTTRLMVEPAECLTTRDYDAVIVVASAQSGKTQTLMDNWAFHTIAHDPVDFLMVEKSEGEARKHSKTKFDRTVAASPRIASKMTIGHGNNVHEKRTKSGAFIWIKWPTKNTLSGATISRIALTDYDRMPDDIDGEGPAFDLAYSRRTYFGSRGMVMAESSPSKPIIDPKWVPETKHEAPPTIGILGLYNTGDRRRVYSRCPHCGEWIMLEASPDVIHTPDGIDDEHQAARMSSLICPESGCLIGMEHEIEFKRNGRWVRDGQTINKDGSTEDDGRVMRRASFWLPGWFASFASWQSIITEYLMALRQFERAGDEEALKSAVNTKIGGPYWSVIDKAAAEGTSTIVARREDSWERWCVPDGACVVNAFVDVQKYSFEVGVIARGRENERWVLGRFAIRRTVDGADLRPAVHYDHWQIITSKVVASTYRLPDGLELRVHRVCVDSGGEPGATERAYEYWRSLPHELRPRVLLVKGVKTHGARGLTKLTYPDSRRRKDRPGGGKGDVPVLDIKSNQAKDALQSSLQQDIPGRNYIHIPHWISDKHVAELRSEKRNEKGEWKQIGSRRNELLDHLYYEHGLWDHLTRGDRVSMDSPPAWASPDWSGNPNVISGDQRRTLKSVAKPAARPQKPRSFNILPDDPYLQ